jgi:hypothetical protein
MVAVVVVAAAAASQLLRCSLPDWYAGRVAEANLPPPGNRLLMHRLAMTCLLC